MARIEIIMPQMGESITEGTIVKWHKKVGDRVKRDETLLDISTDKVDSEIPSPAAGVLAEIVVGEQQTVAVGTVIAYLSEAEGAPVAPTKPAAPVAAAASGASQPAVPAATKPARKEAARFYSPLVLNIAQTEGVSMAELETIPGTGEGGRLTKKDLLAFVEGRKKGTAAPAPAAPVAAPEPPQPAPAPPPVAAAPADLASKYPGPDYEILQMSNVMQKMAQHMVASIHTSPHVAAIHEVDMTAVVRHRSEHAEEFEKKEGFKLTFTPYVAGAVVQALKKYPLVNSSVEGDKIVKKLSINLGVAVATEAGLLVPVIKHAEEKNFTGLARAISDLANRTRTKRLTPDEVQGGTFTISNFGVFGTMIGTPLINQPQVAILGTGAIKKRPVVINDAIAVRSIAYFTLSFDHRIIDGALGGMFLEQIVRNLQDFDTTMKF